jgi:peptidoglycan/LPS O-acetylase OafA/YrhL
MRLRDRPLSHWVLLATLGQLAARAVVGGIALVVDPSGALANASPAPLAATPLDDFLLPGVLLFALFGIGSALAGYGLHARRPWGRAAAIAVGVSLGVWVGVETALGFVRPTRALNLATAFAVLALAASPLVRSSAGGRTESEER